MQGYLPPEVFADGIGEISLSGGMVRIDLVSLLGPRQGSNEQAQAIVRQRVIMPPDGFLRAFAAMENLVRQLEKAGAVKRQSAAATAPAQSGANGNPDPTKSPNFG
ncbi:MAG: hypothetical protein HY246_23260 [Proteobacteria bacterium]|nr:hypothetical protein [Pseudomonadota bacterium]